MSDPAAREATTYPAAELDRRFYAFAVDRLVAWGIFVGAGYLSWRYLLEEDKTAAGIAAIVGTIVLVSMVYAVLLGVAGTSPGKALVGLRVVRYDDGRPIGIVKALLRTAVLGMFTLPTVGLGLATLAWTAVMDPGGRRRGGHDRMCDGVVIDVRPVPVTAQDRQRPRAIVNLTAMRLMPSPPVIDQVAVPARVDRPVASAGPPPAAVVPPPSPAQHVPPPAPTAPAPTPLPPATPPAPAPTPTPVPEPAISGPTQRRPDPAPSVETGRWRVTFDSGETFVVEGLALVGRRPEPRSGEPVKHLVPLRSTDMSLSKTHAQFQVVPDGALVVMDRGSTNGSVVVRQGVSKSLTAGRPSTLVDGDTVRFGDRSMIVAKDL